MIRYGYKEDLSQTEHKVKAQFLMGENDHILTQREVLMFPSDFSKKDYNKYKITHFLGRRACLAYPRAMVLRF